MNKKILVVDNHPAMLKFVSALLEKKGHQIWTAQDGLSALDILKENIPHVVFIDLVMPNIRGEKLCRMIRSLPGTEDTHIFILSAIVTEEEIDFTALGADGCIAKGPFDKMAANILAALKQLDQPPKASSEIIGSHDVDSREITRELLFSKRHLEVILDHMQEGILELSLNGRVISVNAAAVSIMGIPEEKILGAGFADLFGGTQHQEVLEIMARLGHSPDHARREHPFEIDGKHVLLRVFPVHDPRQKSIAVILNDVTEKRRIEAQLRHSEKMEAIGTLAGGIAHDFNNLLMAIQGNANLLRIQKNLETSDREKLKKIEEYVSRGAELTRQLLGFARKGKYQIQALDFNRIVQSSLNMFCRTAKEITIHPNYEHGLWTVEADPCQMEQVMLNLFINAWQAMPEGGNLTLHMENLTLNKAEADRLGVEPGDHVRITVSDTGIGMDDNTLKRIFEPFFTTKEMGKGVGLGLASVYGIIKNHGGGIDVKSSPGNGTVFHIYLPAFKNKPISPGPQIVDEICASGKRETVLLVDDEEMILETGAQMLMELGYRPLCVRNGNDALSCLKEPPSPVGMVILDMIMPDMDGGKTFNEIRRIDPHMRVLLSSGYPLNGNINRLLQQGAAGFIQKPYKMSMLSRKIKDLLQ